MGKKARRTSARNAPIDPSEVEAVGPREPCPCGSGKRYKQCHGKAAHRYRPGPPVRPFEGLPGEADWIALRSFVPAATAPLRLVAPHADREVLLASLLPMALPAMVRPDGAVWLGAQVQDPGSGDPSRDLAAALTEALAAEPEQPVSAVPETKDGDPRLQDLLDTSAPLRLTLHQDMSFWTAGEEPDPELAASLERVNEAMEPTERLTSVEAAYWVRLAGRCHLRWVLPYTDDDLLAGLARLHGAGGTGVTEESKLLGSYRAFGVGVPVWELGEEVSAEALEEPVAEFAERLREAVADDTPLTGEQRRARDGLLARQITLR